MRVELSGGPMCGMELERAKRPPRWVFVDPDGRVWRDPGRNRECYREVEPPRPRPDVTVFLYAGHSHAKCPSCGTFHQLSHDLKRKGRCSLCDAPLA